MLTILEYLHGVIVLTALALLVSVPVLVAYKVRHRSLWSRFVLINLISLSVSFVVLVAGLGALPELKKDLALDEFRSQGYDSDGLSRDERTRDLPSHLHDKAEAIYDLHPGVPPKLGAFMAWMLHSPYPSCVLLAHVLIERLFRRRMATSQAPRRHPPHDAA